MSESKLTVRPLKPIARQIDRGENSRLRRPFWLSASSYYLLAVALATGFFFIGWGLLHDGVDESTWVTSGVGAGIVLFGAVLLREVFLRRARNRYLRHELSLKRQIDDVRSRFGVADPPNKLTIERNSVLIEEIRRKSDAAKVLGKFAAVHREVFELCDSYLAKNDDELRHIGVGSPRLGPLRKGRDTVGRYHRYHMLKWAEIETASLDQSVREKHLMAEKVEAARNAIGVIDFALDFYPRDRSLLESRDVLSELTLSIEVSGKVELAERAILEGDLKNARSHYRDALFRLGRGNTRSENREHAAERINAEIEKLDRSLCDN